MSPPDAANEKSRGAGSPSVMTGRTHKGHGSTTIDSLETALAGMHMNRVHTTGTTSDYGPAAAAASSAAAASPFAIARDTDWGDFTDAAQAAFPSSVNGAITKSHADVSNDDVLDQNEAFDLFPSPNASKANPNDVFRFSQSNLSGIEDRSPQSDASTYRYNSQSVVPAPSPVAFGDMVRPVHDPRRRTESPSCSVTGTTASSRSVSPYTNSSNDMNSGRTIQAYQRSSDVLARNPSSFTEDDRSISGYSSHPSLATLDSAHRSPYAKDWNANIRNTSSPYDHVSDRYHHSDMVAPPMIPVSAPPTSASAGQPQVLYMAVPSPDGRGQVLQPVQMVHVGGKSNYFVSNTQQHDGASLPPLVQKGNEFIGSTSMESRNRVVNYAIENSSNRYFDAEIATTTMRNDDFGRLISDSSVTVKGGQYQVDSAVAQLYATPQRPPLEALIGQVRRLSRDQVGCRLVQQALDDEGPMAATLILNEGLQFWGEAMVDPFGNYLFQKILEKITPDERIVLVKTVSPRLVNASLNLHGTRSVQKVVELCSMDEPGRAHNGVEESAADILTAALAPAAARLCIDSHGNHVIQRILLKLGPKHTKFVFDAVAASVADVARHRHGCCVIQRCLDSPQNEARGHLVYKIVENSFELMQDAYGNYVVQYVLDVCSDEDVAAVCESVIGQVNLLAIQKFSSNVMEKCLERCSDRVKEHYLSEMSNPERIRELMMDPFGNYVVQRALSVATHIQAVRLVEVMKPHLLATQIHGPHGQRSGGVRNTAGGRRIIAKICRRFPNFTLSTVASNDEIYSTNRVSTHRHHQAPVLAASYAPIGQSGLTQNHSQQFFPMDPFVGDPRMTQAHAIPQPYYTLGGTPYYEAQYNGGHGGFTDML